MLYMLASSAVCWLVDAGRSPTLIPNEGTPVDVVGDVGDVGDVADVGDVSDVGDVAPPAVVDVVVL
jgi:hypothetical protein